jgi:hypothetical protein
MDIEKVLINKLKLTCGVEFTANVEGIVCDFYINRESNEKFKIWLKEQKQLNNESIIPTTIETNVYFI